MSSLNQINGVPASSTPELITGTAHHCPITSSLHGPCPRARTPRTKKTNLNTPEAPYTVSVCHVKDAGACRVHFFISGAG